jgi:hypothetical protein
MTTGGCKCAIVAPGLSGNAARLVEFASRALCPAELSCATALIEACMKQSNAAQAIRSVNLFDITIGAPAPKDLASSFEIHEPL